MESDSAEVRGLLEAIRATHRALSKGTLSPGITVEQATSKLHNMEVQLEELSSLIREKHIKSIPTLHQLPARGENLMQVPSYLRTQVDANTSRDIHEALAESLQGSNAQYTLGGKSSSDTEGKGEKGQQQQSEDEKEAADRKQTDITKIENSVDSYNNTVDNAAQKFKEYRQYVEKHNILS
eukprot:gb/GECG01008264.1/.p1 GENE.gb/GECG01008264.1/~~gb/GECG01008264.1/.p1  ORF type:complete len:181 (+),score=33.81 gb/GECG01008264.1/:1-543(+)